MKRARLRKPALSQGKSTRPRDPVFLAPAAESTPPERQHPVPERPQARKVSWYRVVIEVALDDRLQPSSGLGQRIVHAHPKLLLDLSQLASYAFADRFAPYHEAPETVLPADMSESQKVERLRLPFSSTFPVLFGKPAEFDPARLVWV